MKQNLLILILILFLDGCVINTGPKDNQDFYRISQLAELVGVYKNKGDPEGYYLSQIIWGRTKMSPVVDYQVIELIEVSSTENSLTAKAILKGCVVYEQTYVIGRDFEIDDGKIVLRSDLSLTEGLRSGLMLGPSYEKITLGLDAGKNGKYRDSGYAAGLGLMVIPMAIAGNNDVRFERVADKPQVFQTCR